MPDVVETNDPKIKAAGKPSTNGLPPAGVWTPTLPIGCRTTAGRLTISLRPPTAGRPHLPDADHAVVLTAADLNETLDALAERGNADAKQLKELQAAVQEGIKKLGTLNDQARALTAQKESAEQAPAVEAVREALRCSEQLRVLDAQRNAAKEELNALKRALGKAGGNVRGLLACKLLVLAQGDYNRVRDRKKNAVAAFLKQPGVRRALDELWQDLHVRLPASPEQQAQTLVDGWLAKLTTIV